MGDGGLEVYENEYMKTWTFLTACVTNLFSDAGHV